MPLFGVRIFKAKTDRWSLILFGDERRPYVSYDYKVFERMKEELNIRNTGIIVDKTDHEKIKELIYQVGLIQNRFPQKEYLLENKRLDVVWRRTPKEEKRPSLRDFAGILKDSDWSDELDKEILESRKPVRMIDGS